MNEGLFQTGHFKLASGVVSNWKIECDSLTDEDWKTLASMIAARCGPFGSVFGVPTGGDKLANELRAYTTQGPRLLVDDVWTTGGSIRKYRQDDDIVWVVFARSQPTDGTKALMVVAEG